MVSNSETLIKVRDLHMTFFCIHPMVIQDLHSCARILHFIGAQHGVLVPGVLEILTEYIHACVLDIQSSW